MSDVLSFYFDGMIVQAVKVRIVDGATIVKDARSFPLDEFDGYLSNCKEKICILSCNPPFFYQDILHLPPAAEKLYDKLVRCEIQNLHPDLSSFSIFHCTVGESSIDGKTYKKIAVFSYPDEFLSHFIQVVNQHNISITHSYSTPHSIFRLAFSTCDSGPDQTRIFIATLPGEKLLLVCENSELEFIRKMPSLSNVMLPEDAQNINMTVDYCFQSLRVRPLEAVMLNNHELSEDLSFLTSVPLRAALPLQLKSLEPHLIQDYLAPISAALHFVTSPHIGNVLPADYVAFSKQKRIFTIMTVLMLVATVLLVWGLVNETITGTRLKSKISRIRTELSGSANELASFRKLDEEVNKLKQPLEVVNKHNSSLNPATALAALTLPESPEYTIRGVTVQAGATGIDVQLQGAINAARYSDTQAAFERFISNFIKLPGYSVVSSTIDIRQKTFSIQARYNSERQANK